jgi:hypothetical protein
VIVLFCADPVRARHPDASYAGEAAAVAGLALPHALLDYEALVERRDQARAIRLVETQPAETAGLYRGWMMAPAHYAQLFTALLGRNIRLINDPEAYRHCHHLPASLEVIAGRTPATVWLRTGPDVDVGRVMDLLRPFGDRPLIVKDFVKSRKHEWHEACFIPSASDRGAVERVVRRFIELQGPDLAEGLVFREYVELELLGVHDRSGMPLAKEFRIFYLDSEPLSCSPYWDEGGNDSSPPLLDEFAAIAQSVRSRFFTMDVARRRDGGWIIVELGDGQVAGLPGATDVGKFYSFLGERGL